MKYKLTIPYPKYHSIKPNKYYGFLLLNHLNNIHSVMSSFNNFMYYSIIFSKNHIDISKAFKQIYKTKFKHIELLLDLCFQLDVDPRLWIIKEDHITYWSAEYNIYLNDINDIFNHLILVQNNIINDYYLLLNNISDIFIKKTLNRIILDETLHLDILNYFNKNI